MSRKTKTKQKKQSQPVEATPVDSKPWHLALCFAFPFAIMGTAFALHKVYPFGGKLMLNGDMQAQFYPFLSSFWHKLREGSLSPWSWTAGGGHDYAALFAYYLTSPLNLLAVLVPHSWLREAVALLLLVKIGCAGLFAGIFLRSAAPPQRGTTWPLALPVFSSFYALCAFTLGYYIHIVWFDSFALLPLVMLGLTALINEGKYRLYVISLALAVFTNYHIGFYICIFVVITFFGQCVIQKFNYREFLRKLGLIAAYSALAAGMAAAVLIPAWSALQNTSLQGTAFPPKVVWFGGFFDVLGNFAAFQPPTNMYGLSNLYSGLVTVMLAGLFACSPKVSRREKIVLAGTIVFLLISCNLNMLEYIWNGFNYTRGMPFRYSFLVTFLLVTVAYRAFADAQNVKWQSLLVMAASTALILVSAAIGPQERTAVIGSAVLCAAYLILLFFRGKGAGWARRLTEAAFFLAIVTELSIGTWIGIKASGTTDRDNFPDRYEQVQALLALRQPAGVNFYRTDTDIPRTLNNPFLYHYDGVSIYSSTVSVNVAEFMHGLGLLGWDRDFNYNETSPMFNAFLNMRYVINMRGSPKDTGTYWETVGKAEDSLLLENKYYLPLGFMVKEGITSYAHQIGNPFLSQNDLFSRATGLEGSLFTVTDVTKNIPTPEYNKFGNRLVYWNYEMPSDGMLYVYTACPKAMYLGIYVNDDFLFDISNPDRSSFITAIGDFTRGDVVTFLIADGNDISIYTGCFDSELFERGYARLASQPLILTKFTDTQVSGHVEAAEDGLLYASIPGDKNWNAYVDGAKSDIVLIDGAMAAVRLNKGPHEVEFRYFNKSLLAGIITSLVSLAVFAALVLAGRLKRRQG